MSVWIVIPAFNEAENLAVLIPTVVKHLLEADRDGRLLVVDDGSTDGTAAVARNLARDYRRDDGTSVLRLMVSPRNRGKAAALQDGFRASLADGADRIVMMDADGQDDPAELPRLLAPLSQGYGVVTGARLERNDRFVKRRTSRVYNRVTGLMSGTPGRDFNSGYKAMTAAVARDVSNMMYGELHRYLTVIAHWFGYAVTEVPVRHHPRMHGSSKYGVARFWRGFLDLLTVRFLMSYEARPSHLFGGVGSVTFLVGVLMLGYLLLQQASGQAIGDRPMLIAGVMLVVVGVQFLLFGLLAELIVYGRRHDTGRGAPEIEVEDGTGGAEQG